MAPYERLPTPIQMPPIQRRSIPAAATGRIVENVPGAVGRRIERRNRPTNVSNNPTPIFVALERGARRRRRAGGAAGLAIGPPEGGRKITCPPV
jgi:hypothetical protein